MIRYKEVNSKKVKNVMDQVKKKFKKQVSDYGIKEVFILDGELHITSDSDISQDFIKTLEDMFI